MATSMTYAELMAKSEEFAKQAIALKETKKTEVFEACVKLLKDGGYTAVEFAKHAEPEAFVVPIVEPVAKIRKPREVKVDAEGNVIKSSPLAGVSPPAKYRGPNGEEWSGRGQLAKWIKASGKDKSMFLINPAVVEQEVKPETKQVETKKKEVKEYSAT